MYLKVILTSHMRDNSDNEDAEADVNSDINSFISLFNKEKSKQVKSEKLSFH